MTVRRAERGDHRFALGAAEAGDEVFERNEVTTRALEKMKEVMLRCLYKLSGEMFRRSGDDEIF